MLKRTTLAAVSAAFLSSPTLAVDDSVNSEGAVGDLQTPCAISQKVTGYWSYNDSTGDWDRVSGPQFRVVANDAVKVTVTNDGTLYNKATDEVVDELGFYILTDNAVITQVDGTGTITASYPYGNWLDIEGFTNGDDILDVQLNHTFTPTASFVPQANTTYYIVHDITCAY